MAALSLPNPTPTATPPPPTPTSAPVPIGPWNTTGGMAVTRRDHTATLLDDGRVLIVGGTSSTAELYDPATGMFGPLGSVPFSQGLAAAKLADGRVLVVRGQTAKIYNNSTGVFTDTGNLNVGRNYPTATLLADGRVLVAGGQDRQEGSNQSLAVAELYDPATGNFSLTGSLQPDRVGFDATLLVDGKVLLAGGTQTTTPGYGICLSSAELYDPVSGTFTTTGTLTFPRCSPSVALLNSGKALFSGWSLSPEVYDPITGTFSVAGSMASSHNASTATLLNNGKVLVAGGRGQAPTNAAEIYDPLQDTFAPAGEMTNARQQHTATLLQNGQVLIVGGYGGTSDLSPAELFTLNP